MADKIENISIENARLVFRNFSGNPDKYNSKGGKRQFSVVIEDRDVANALREEGWNIKDFRPRDEEDENPGSYLPVKVSYEVRPPHIYIVTGKTKKLLNEDTVGSLDYAEISGVDIIITPYPYDVNGHKGISAYVKTMYVNVVEDEFASKYEDEETPF